MKLLEKIVFKIFMALALTINAIFYPNKVVGKENIPKDGAFILYSNHQAIWDALLLVTAFRKRKVYFMGKEELFKSNFTRWFFGALGGFPVSRGNADMRAIKQCINYLDGGDALMIFPEGTRNETPEKGLMEFKTGVAIIVFRTGAPALPCFIDAPKGIKPFKRSTIRIGTPIDTSEYHNKKITSANLEECMTTLKDELEKLA